MKISHLILLPLSLAVLAGCNGNKDDRIASLQYGQMINNQTETISYQALSEKVDSKETFLVTVYAPGCTCWSTFQAVLGEYISETHVYVYSISYKEFENGGESRDNFGMKLKSGYTSFAIFKDGKVLMDVNSEKNELKQIDLFKKMMETYVTLPKMFYVSKDQVDELYTSDKKSVIYFARSNCSDCSDLNSRFLDTYKTTYNLYILDCEKIGIREYQEDGIHLTPESQAKWNAFKVEYGLANTNNAKYGYNSGYVPSLFLIQGSGDKNVKTPTFLSGSVYFNDTVEELGGQFKVTDSYYTPDRLANLAYASGVEHNVLAGLDIPSEDVDSIKFGENTYYSWKKDKAAEYHVPLVKAFLDENLKEVTHTGF
ncbi:MAG: hypothetical protein K6E11_03725 [Bacilli bacterium]|nr:hypothetical protein [Bacilli bacterium]